MTQTVTSFRTSFPKGAPVLVETKHGKQYGTVKAHADKYGEALLVEFYTDEKVWIPLARTEVVVVEKTAKLIECFECSGRGLFYMGGGTVNGVFTGKTGPCFRCNGTGKQSYKDMLRNRYYDNHVRRLSV